MVLSIIRWLRGTVTFIISGVFPERLISCCQKIGVTLWNIKPKNGGISADSYACDYKKLRHYAKITGTKIRITEKRGAFVLRHRYRKRQGIAVGAVLAVVFIIFCSSRIWRIEVNGCSGELKETILDQMKQNGVKIGYSKSKIDVKTIRRSIMLEDDRIAWIAVNIVGSTAFVEVSEAKAAPEVIDPSEKVANIVAECDGQIKYMEIYDGQPLVKVGETVSKGDVIVSGIMEDQYGKKQLKYARAKVIARVNEEIKVSVPLKQSVWQMTGQGKNKWYLSYGEKMLPISFGKLPSGNYSVKERRTQIIFFDIIKRAYTPQIFEEITLNEKQAKEYAMSLLDKKDIDIDEQKLISRSRKAELFDGIYTVTEHRQVERDIAKTVEIEWLK